jgi:magnesium transporter
MAPGTVVYTGPRRMERTRIEFLDYTAETLEERELDSIEEALSCRDTDHVSWLNIDGLHDTDLMQKVGDHFGLHPLVMEDIVNTHQRPKVEEYDGYVFVVARMLYVHDGELASEQLAFVLGPRWLLSFQEVHGDVFSGVRDRIRAGKGRLRKLGPDYLLYALLDAVIDHYFVVLEAFGERIETLEEELTEDPSPELLHRIHDFKRQSLLLRKAVWPMREVVGSLQRLETDLVKDETDLFLRDAYDHTIQSIDAIENFRDMLSSLQDLYLSSISNRMNEVMKVLTIIATIFVPLTFLAGIYGMNFDVLPELHWRWGYAAFWGVTVALGAAMVSYFHRKRWL